MARNLALLPRRLPHRLRIVIIPFNPVYTGDTRSVKKKCAVLMDFTGLDDEYKETARFTRAVSLILD